MASFTFGASQAASTAPASGGSSLFGASGATGLGTSLGASLFQPTASQQNAAPQGSLFGSSLFGASQQPAQQPQQPSLFGQPAQPAATAGPSLFGAPAPAAPAATSLFGAPAAAQAPAATSLFGAPAAQPAQPAQPTNLGLFGNLGGQQPAQQSQMLLSYQQQQAQAQMQQAAFLQSQARRQPTVEEQLQEIFAAWDPSNPRYQFMHYFYNLVHPSEAAFYQPPPGTDPSLFLLAQRNNPDPTCLVPVLAKGFADVNRRVEVQERTAREQEAALAALEARLEKLRDRHYTATAAAAERLTTQGVELARRLTVLMKQVHVLVSRGLPLKPAEEQLRAKLEAINAQFRVRAKVDELLVVARRLGDAKGGPRRSAVDSGVRVRDPVEWEKILKVLSEQTRGLRLLTDTLREDEEEIKKLQLIIDRETRDPASLTNVAWGLGGMQLSDSQAQGLQQQQQQVPTIQVTGPTGSGLFGSQTGAGTGLFGQPAGMQPAGGLFGQPTTTQPATGLFGQPAAGQTSTGLFGQSATTQPAGGLFGQPATTQPATNLFGQPATTQPAGGLFGQPATTQPATSLFGQPATTQPAGGGLFGQPATTQPAAGALFGQPAATQPAGGLFGQPATTQPATGLFGQPAATAAPAFGSAPAQLGGLFGQPAATQAGGLFGAAAAAPAPAPATGGLFGSAAGTSQGLFGATAPAAPATGLFGATPTATPLFGK
ncbi:nucleoporin complex subunit 54-domain-containing protein [Hyaloraphidium curvatum]|nr:nucleoporin complex subunit 54-domain-containing protein [Hyaloraphidium curvatum]